MLHRAICTRLTCTARTPVSIVSHSIDSSFVPVMCRHFLRSWWWRAARYEPICFFVSRACFCRFWFFCPPRRNKYTPQLSIKFGVDLDAVNRTVLRSVNSGTRSPQGDAGAVLKKKHASAGDNDTPWPTSVLHAATEDRKMSPRIFLTCQEDVLVASDGAGGGKEECVVLRYAIGGDVSLAEAWPMVVERTREVMKSELGHVHFCNCFSWIKGLLRG